MAKRRKQLRLAAGEIEILEMLWRQQSVTLAEAHRALAQPIGYTTVQTRLNRMLEKGIVARSKSRPARYRATISPDDVTRQDLETLVRRVNAGRVVPLVAHLVQDRSLSADEIRQLKQLIAEAERNSRSREPKEDGK